MTEMSPSPLTLVGASPRRLDIAEKLSGRAQYIADMTRPNMLHGAIVQSPYAHARILGSDLSKALALPGVAAVLTGEDLGHHPTGALIKDETVLPRDRVRYLGQPVAVVAAEDEATARAAARLVEIDYEPLDAVLTIDEALAPGAPLVHENQAQYFRLFPTEIGGNVCWTTTIAEGDVASAWAECDVIVEGEYETQAQAHIAMEPCGALAEVDGNGRVTLWSANQGVHYIQASVCEGLGLPMSKLRSIVPKVGGGFGNKIEVHVQAFVVALTLATGLPVKMILNREEDFETNRFRHPFRIRSKTGAKRDGTLVAREVDVIVDCGAYGDESPGVMGFAMFMARGPYRIPNSSARGRLVYTNKIRFGAFRGYGNPQVCFATESQLDELAEKLGMDPLELRLKNALRKGDKWVGGGAVNSSGFVGCLEAIRDASNWPERHRLPSRPGWRRGMGLGCSCHISGLMAASALVRILEDGSVALNTGAVEIGQGCETALAQIVAESLKVPLDWVTSVAPDTDSSPYNWATAASRIMYMVGGAVAGAAASVEKQLKTHAAEIFNCPIEELELRPGGRVASKTMQGMELSFRDISLRAHYARGGPIMATHSHIYDQPAIDPKVAAAAGVPFPQIGAFTFGAAICDLEIEEATGKVVVNEAWSACDVGQIINRQGVEGQIEGGFLQGLGFALFEEVRWDGPRISNPSMMDYKIATVMDAPKQFHTLIIEEPEPGGPFGAKGIGEIPICPVAPAVANGIAAAAGMRLRQLPLTGERVLTGLLRHEAEGDGID
jgi:CO/xanthine dehydrogenase Mo-binding subunit